MNEPKVKELFQQALEIGAPERAAFLDRVCAGSDTLRSRVEALLAAHGEVGTFLRNPTRGVPAPPEAREASGTVIGSYKLLQKIGEGGFGVVYMAEQTAPVRRNVALKIIKLGMDTKQVVARFDAERQALAVMDHPNIAKVFDAGATETGRPYFVMELVKGIPITQYCDQAHLDTAERLLLFQDVCHAVQHAHHKGIIHRDLKPSNVLVTLHDGRPVPKVIDFGIAKATDHRLTQKTLFTEFRQMVGTPEYMAPEQAELGGLDIDTRADVYALGVVLYELLTGAKPFDLRTLLERGYDEVLRTIREVEPPKPSMRVSTMGEQLPTVARNRHTQPRLLGRLIRGDLDWIVMKALEKDRSRRYETADGFAQDIERYLRDQPVLAGPPSGLYRLRKYVQRHRFGVAAAAGILAALVVGGVLALAGYLEARHQRNAARDAAGEAHREAVLANTVVDLVRTMLRSANPTMVKGRNYPVRRILDDFDRDLGGSLTGQPGVEATIRTVIGEAYVGLGLPDKAERHLEAALAIRRRLLGEEHALFAESMAAHAEWLVAAGREAQAEAEHRRALAIRRRVLGDLHADVVKSIRQLAHALQHLGRHEEAIELAEQATVLSRRVFGEEHREVAAGLQQLAVALERGGRADEAEAPVREGLDMRRRLFGEEHPSVAESLNSLALVMQATGRHADAEPVLRRALAMRRQLLGEHPLVAESLANLAFNLEHTGSREEVERLQREAVEMVRELLGADHPTLPFHLNNHATALLRLGRLEDAEQRVREALDLDRRLVGEEHRDTVLHMHELANVLSENGKYAEAERIGRELIPLRRRVDGETVGLAHSVYNLALVYQRTRDHERAEARFREAMALYRRLEGDEHGDVAACMHSLALAFLGQGRNDDAERQWWDAFAMVRRILPADHGPWNQRVLRDVLAGLAGKLRRESRWDEAASVYRDAIDTYRAVLGEKHAMVPELTHEIGHVLQDKDEPEAAVRQFRAAFGMRREDPAGDEDLACLGRHFRRRGAPGQAEPFFRDLVERVRQRGGGGLGLANALAMLGTALLDQEKYAEAEPVARECLELRAKEIPDRWPRYNAMNLLGGALAGQGKYAEAEPLLVEGYENMPPETAARAKREAQERIVRLYDAWGKPDEAAAWRAKFPPPEPGANDAGR